MLLYKGKVQTKYIKRMLAMRRGRTNWFEPRDCTYVMFVV